MTISRILIGLLLLILGRQLYWLFVGGVGFITAINLVSYGTSSMPVWLMLIIALGAGLVGALLAIFLQEVAVGLAGFLAGGSVVLSLLEMFTTHMPALTWIPVLLGAVIGLIVAVAFFDWALILLSSLSGASLLARSFTLSPWGAFFVFASALIVGIMVQATWMRRSGTCHNAVPQES